jgi:hypothetical protein
LPLLRPALSTEAVAEVAVALSLPTDVELPERSLVAESSPVVARLLLAELHSAPLHVAFDLASVVASSESKHMFRASHLELEGRSHTALSSKREHSPTSSQFTVQRPHKQLKSPQVASSSQALSQLVLVSVTSPAELCLRPHPARATTAKIVHTARALDNRLMTTPRLALRRRAG